MKKLLYAAIFLVVLVAGLTFALKNPEYVSIQYYFGVDFRVPLSLLIVGCLVAGVIIGYLAGRLGGYRRRRRADRVPGPSSPSKNAVLSGRGG
jgi:uncharacterized integral membrane protein